MLVPRMIQKIIVLEVLMWQLTKMFKNGFKDYLFCGNQKQSGAFKITKKGFERMTQKERNVSRSIVFQLERTSWKLS